MKYAIAILFTALLALNGFFMAPALIAKNTPKSFDMLITMGAMLSASITAAYLVARNKD